MRRLALGVVLAYGLVRGLLNALAVQQRLNERLDRIESLLEAGEASARRIADLAPLSDAAKGMIYREREVEAVREVIHESLAQEDYKRAEQLIDQIEHRFGFQAEAEKFRAEVAASREATMEEKISAAVERVDQLIAQRNWARALREAERLASVFAQSEKVGKLRRRVLETRNAHKRQPAPGVQRGRQEERRGPLRGTAEGTRPVPQPAGGGRHAGSVRGVFRAKLLNLGVRFAIAVTDERRDLAVQTGEEIVNEFPNTRMATEVREKMDHLCARASTVRAV